MGALLSFIGLIMVLGAAVRWFWLAIKVEIPHDSTNYASVWGIGGALGLFGLAFGGGGIAGTAMILGFLLFYLVNTGAQKVGANELKVGSNIPAFSATDDAGNAFDSAALGGKPMLLKFFRGHW